MEECGMKSRSPVTRQGDGGGAGWGAPSVRTPGCSGRVTAQPELCLCLASTSTVLCSRLLFVWPPATVPTTTTPVSAIRQMEPIKSPYV